MANENILVVEDDKDIFDLILFTLNKEGFKARGVMTGEDVFAETSREIFDLILLDLMLPGIDGLEVCRRLRWDSKTKDIPIIIVSAKTEEADVVTGLELGANDYITKPFSPKVLTARIRAILRQKLKQLADEGGRLKIHDLSIHPGRHEVLVDGQRVDLTVAEFRLLHLLMSHPGWVFSRYQIVDAIHGQDYHVTDRSVDVQCAGLRKKLGIAGKYIETVRGIGYRFRE
jgi:two-component system phosphate regulon response regulator PhoB